jgi:hypothetical protein
MKERRLWVLENRVLRRIFGPERNEVTGEYIMMRHVVCISFHIFG